MTRFINTLYNGRKRLSWGTSQVLLVAPHREMSSIRVLVRLGSGEKQMYLLQRLKGLFGWKKKILKMQ
jgi:hypothetical protein